MSLVSKIVGTLWFVGSFFQPTSVDIAIFNIVGLLWLILGEIEDFKDSRKK